ncbi:hypothetical protein Tco_0685463 [Tanacetum coccineum]
MVSTLIILCDYQEFGDSYRAPAQDKSVSGEATPSSRSKGRTVAVTAEDMQKERNDVKNDRHNESGLLYNHLKVYESEVQKKGGSSSQNMAFISSSNTNSGKSEVPTAQSFSTASGQVTTASTEVATATFSHDTICAYIATQQSGSQIKYEDITQIDDDDIKEIDIKWNMALLSMRADRFWKKTGKKITIQGSDVARAPRSQDRSRRESYKKEPKVEEPSHKAMMAIDGIGWD